MSDWRYQVIYEGVVEADDEKEARINALDDVDNGKLPHVEVEPVDEGSEG